MSCEKAEIFGVPIDVLDLASAVQRIVDLRLEGGGGCVVTPNLDHVVRLRGDEIFEATYDNASVVLADGMPLVWASRLGGTPLPGRVAGSDLILPLCAAAAEYGLRVFLFGTSYQVLCESARRLHGRFPRLEISGVYSPAQGFRQGSAEDDEVLALLGRTRPDLIFVALGCPKQEIWADRCRDQLRPAVLVSIGAGLDFIAGKQRRAPRWIRSVGLEWAYRALSNPARLGPRYVKDLFALPGLITGQLCHVLRQRRN